jgi:hypothetical protein
MFMRLLGLDIVLHLATIGATQADDSAYCAAVHERHVVKETSTRSQGDHPALAVLEPIVDSDQRLIPIKLGGQRKRNTVLGLVRSVFERVEFDQHNLL